jgi:hypothetical protein
MSPAIRIYPQFSLNLLKLDHIKDMPRNGCFLFEIGTEYSCYKDIVSSNTQRKREEGGFRYGRTRKHGKIIDDKSISV